MAWSAAAMLALGLPGMLASAPAVAADAPAPLRLDVRAAGPHSLRITVRPPGYDRPYPEHPAIVDRDYPAPALSVREPDATARAVVSGMVVSLSAEPRRLRIARRDGELLQELTFRDNGNVEFLLDDNPVLGMGEGGPLPAPDSPWREQPVQFDRRGVLDELVPRWQADMYGSRNPVAMLFGTGGWGLFVATPWVHVDLRDPDTGVFMPWRPTAADREPQSHDDQQLNRGKGLPPADSVVPGLLDLFVFDARDPTAAIGDFSRITGPAAMPPKWALGYMQSHRTLEGEEQMLDIVDTFRRKQIPLDAVIYLGTGFAPVGWNREQPSFEFNPDVFERDPDVVLDEFHDKHVRAVVHMVPWDRDRLPTLHGSIPRAPGETLDRSHIASYWRQHVPLMRAGVDAFWPDEGDWFDLFERLKRHQMYYQGPLSTRPEERPWSLHRNGYPGIAQWGGWVWSGDTESSWKTLEAQIAVGINYSLSIGPYWGSDIGGFYPNRELTGELYARWFQFGAFCASFRAHGRVWWMRLPWAWGGDDRGPQEYGSDNAPIPEDDPRKILPSAMNDPTIEPIARQYAELRYRLLPYTYTLAWQARDTGLPLMRALWLHYPDDPVARRNGSEYLWGRDLLIAPVFEPGADSRELYLPAGDWYDWWTGAKLAGGRRIARAVDLQTLPIYVRAGTILPTDPVRQYTGQQVAGPTTLTVYPGADGSFTLYEDDGENNDYRDGGYALIPLAWNDADRTLTIGRRQGGYPGMPRARDFRVVFAAPGEAEQGGAGETARLLHYSGETLVVRGPPR